MIQPQYPLTKLIWRKAQPVYEAEDRLYTNVKYLEEGYAFFKSTKINLTLAQEMAWLAHGVVMHPTEDKDYSQSKVWLESVFKKAKLESGEKAALSQALKLMDEMSSTQKPDTKEAMALVDAQHVRFSKKHEDYSIDEQMRKEERPHVSLNQWLETQKVQYQKMKEKSVVFCLPLAQHYWGARATENLDSSLFQHPSAQVSLFASHKP